MIFHWSVCVGAAMSALYRFAVPASGLALGRKRHPLAAGKSGPDGGEARGK